MEHFKLKLDRTSIDRRRPSINVRSLLPSTNCVTKETIGLSQSANSESFRAKTRDTPICFPILTILYLVFICLYFHVTWRKWCHFWCEDCRFVCFATGLGKPMLTLNDPNGLKNTTDVYSIHLELRMAFICQISAGKWKYVTWPMSGFSRYTRSTYGVRKTAIATRMDVRTYVDQVSPPTWYTASGEIRETSCDKS